ncbi:hypothetical protein AAG570_013184 [Ranatra chinensis]|uniref:Integrase catalytic domain-containing protein n=1 Tax=Ranatra chinensis TaxID=642074 RepID=A0ABD0YG10_9HEMI
MDSGAECGNTTVKGFLEELRTSRHITTPGHLRSHGVIERPHSTLGEHMRLLEKGKGITGSEAVIRATIAYNESVHSATGKTPMELMRAWRRVARDMPIEIDMKNVGNRDNMLNWLETVAVICLCYIAYRLLRGLLVALYALSAPSLGLTKNLKATGRWAGTKRKPYGSSRVVGKGPPTLPYLSKGKGRSGYPQHLGDVLEHIRQTIPTAVQAIPMTKRDLYTNNQCAEVALKDCRNTGRFSHYVKEQKYTTEKVVTHCL